MDEKVHNIMHTWLDILQDLKNAKYYFDRALNKIEVIFNVKPKGGENEQEILPK